MPATPGQFPHPGYALPGFPPTDSGVVPISHNGFSPADNRVVRFAVDVKPAMTFEDMLPPDLSVEAIDDDEPAVSFGELLQPDTSAVANMRDMDGFHDEPTTRFLPAPLDQETQRML